MTLPTSGIISIQNIANELGISATGLTLDDSRVRSLANLPTGAISLDNLHGKSNSYLIAGAGTGMFSGKTGYSGPFNENASGGIPSYGTVYNIGRPDLTIDEIVTYMFSGSSKLDVKLSSNSASPITFGIYLNGYVYDSASTTSYTDTGGLGSTIWTWNAPALMVNGVKYSCKLV